MIGPIFDDLRRELALPPVDLTDALAAVQVSCIQLEIYEPGQWWDFDKSTTRLKHPAVMEWMDRYGFSNLRDLTAPALTTFYLSLLSRVAAYDSVVPTSEDCESLA